MLKHFRRILRFLFVAAIVSSATLGADAVADDVSDVLTPFVNDDTFIAARVDVAALLTFGSPGDLIKALPMLSSSPDAPSWTLAARMIEGVIKRFQEAGGQSVYVVSGLADLRVGGGPLAIASCQPGKGEDVERLFQDLQREQMALLGLAGGASNSPAGVFRNSVADQLQLLRKGDRVLIGTKSTVARYATLKSSPRPDVVDPLAKLVGNGAVAAAVFCPGNDYRRVVRELWPRLPGVLAPLRGELADRWLRFELDVNPSRPPQIKLVARDADAAAIFAQLWRDLPTATTQFGGNKESVEMAKGNAQLLVDSLPVSVAGNNATIELPTDEQRIAKLQEMFGEAADKSRAVGDRRTRMTQFKHLTLALLNFESANKHLPPAAICDKDGKPLLSWRVAILPYLDEVKLYKEFHLDEPWDSPHNFALIKKMPNVYADPGRKLAAFARDGKTTYHVPVGPETAFFNAEGTFYRDIKDGTSNTVLIVERDPSRAVVWTKPEDWNVDLAQPRQGLERTDRDYVTLGFADGHVQVINPAKTDEKTLRAFVTRAGGEVIER